MGLIGCIKPSVQPVQLAGISDMNAAEIIKMVKSGQLDGRHGNILISIAQDNKIFGWRQVGQRHR